MGLTARRVEIRVYLLDGRWEQLAVFRDVLDLREERVLEGLVVVFWILTAYSVSEFLGRYRAIKMPRFCAHLHCAAI
jgi:hypothetical protein